MLVVASHSLGWGVWIPLLELVYCVGWLLAFVEFDFRFVALDLLYFVLRLVWRIFLLIA